MAFGLTVTLTQKFEIYLHIINPDLDPNNGNGASQKPYSFYHYYRVIQ